MNTQTDLVEGLHDIPNTTTGQAMGCMCTEEICCFPSFVSFLDYECQGSDSCCDYWPDYKPKSHRYK